MQEPRYWGSWKGRVIKAIVIDGAHTWNEIRDLTELSPDTLNTVLAEMFNLKILDKNEFKGTYWVSDEIYYKYRSYFNQPEIIEPIIREHKEPRPHLRR